MFRPQTAPPDSGESGYGEPGGVRHKKIEDDLRSQTKTIQDTDLLGESDDPRQTFGAKAGRTSGSEVGQSAPQAASVVLCVSVVCSAPAENAGSSASSFRKHHGDTEAHGENSLPKEPD